MPKSDRKKKELKNKSLKCPNAICTGIKKKINETQTLSNT